MNDSVYGGFMAGAGCVFVLMLVLFGIHKDHEYTMEHLTACLDKHGVLFKDYSGNFVCLDQKVLIP